jgi:hypothetical protein
VFNIPSGVRTEPDRPPRESDSPVNKVFILNFEARFFNSFVSSEQFGESPIPAPSQRAQILSFMATKKQPSRKEREIADKKNHPVAKSSRPAIAQNAEAEPRPRKR